MPRKSPAEQWDDRLENSFVPMRKITRDGKLLGFASCCLGDYKGQRIVLSVAHQVFTKSAKTSEPAVWGILSRQRPEKDFYWFPTEVKFLGRLNLATLEMGYVDFSYAVITHEVEAYSQRFDEWTGEITWEKPKTIHRLDFDAKPRREVHYGFAGHTRHTEIEHPHTPVLSYEIVVVDDLSYVGTESDMHVFRLGSKHPGHERFEGCSGAPIISKSGQVVALVCSGSIERDLIYGVSLRAYKTAVNFEVTQSKGQT